MKRHILIPLALLVYLAVIAYITYPARNPDLSYTQYYVTMSVTLVILVLLTCFLKKKEDNRKKNQKK